VPFMYRDVAATSYVPLISDSEYRRMTDGHL
jgi:hypothetical protein